MVNSKIKAAEENLIHVYNRFPIALDHGEGMYLYDTEGKEYLDFAAGHFVSAAVQSSADFVYPDFVRAEAALCVRCRYIRCCLYQKARD